MAGLWDREANSAKSTSSIYAPRLSFKQGVPASLVVESGLRNRVIRSSEGWTAKDCVALLRAKAVLTVDTGDDRARRFQPHHRISQSGWRSLMSGLAAECESSTDEAFRTLEEAEAVAVAAGLLVEQSRIHLLRGNLFFPLGNIDDCEILLF
jgi:hypothetical protein